MGATDFYTPQPGSPYRLSDHPLTQMLDVLRRTKPQYYGTYSFDLGTARTDEEFPFAGDFLIVTSITGTVSIKMNEKENASLDPSALSQITTPFFRLFVTNTAQAGKVLAITYGRDALFTAAVRANISKLVNVAETEINPATEDTLALLNTAVALHKFTTPTNTFATVGVASALALAANANRKYAIFVNDSANIIYLGLGAAAVVGSGIRLNANGGSYEINWQNLYTGEIYAIAGGAGSNLSIIEGA